MPSWIYIPTAASSAPWTPLLLGSSLRAWYDASDSSTIFSDYAGTTPAGADAGVRRINDKSGNGSYLARSNASGASGLTRVVGAVNGRDVLRATGNGFINTESRTPLGTTTIGGLTVLHARKTNPTTQPYSVDWNIAVTGATSDPTFTDIRLGGLQGVIRDMASGPSGYTNPVAGFQHWIDAVRFPVYVSGVPRDSVMVMASRWDGTARDQRIWVNGTAGTSLTHGGSVWDWSDGSMRDSRTVQSAVGVSSDQQIGIGIAYGTAPLHGDLCEYLICDSALGELDRHKAEGYLAHRWGSATSLPEGHPYRSAAPTA